MIVAVAKAAAEQLLCGLRFGVAEFFQGFEEFGEGDTNAFRIANPGVALRAERGDGEGHGDAMVTLRVNFRAPQFSR